MDAYYQDARERAQLARSLAKQASLEAQETCARLREAREKSARFRAQLAERSRFMVRQ